MERKAGFTTRILNTKPSKTDPHNALHMPVYECAAFEFESAEQIADAFQGKIVKHSYSRSTNPSVEYLELKIKEATEGKGVVAMSSGMAAISAAVMALVSTGDNIITTNKLFAHTFSLLDTTLRDFGIDTKVVDLLDLEAFEDAIDDKTRLVIFETITNPQLEIVDIKGVVEVAHRKGIVVVLDSTITPPNVFSSKALGVDIDVMSSTKFISGGATTIGGLVVDNGVADWSKVAKLDSMYKKAGEMAFVAKLRKEIYRNLGLCMSAHNAHMQSLGLDVLALRVERACENSQKVAEYLQGESRVAAVNYPGLKSSGYYEIGKQQFGDRPGAVLTFDLDSQEACFKFMNKLNYIRRATNLNDNKSLIIHPFSTIFSDYPEGKRIEMGVGPNTMRLALGVEEAEDIIYDISQAL